MKDEFKPSVNEKQKITDKKLNIDSPSQEKSPEEIIKSFANINDGTESTTPEKKDFAVPEKYSKKRFLNLSNPFSKLSKLSKKQKIIFIFGIVVLFIVLAGGAYALFKPKSPQNIVSTTTHKTIKKEEPKPTTEASKLSGVQVPIGTNTKTVVSIQIENSPDARPQSGLNEASVIFEAIAEGGITRFNASFLDNSPEYIGPIRSVRPYYAQLVAPFDPVFVHAGGSADGLAMLSSLGLKDFDHGPNGSYFQRVNDRYAPHNLYSSMSNLRQGSEKRGFTTSDTKSFTRKVEKVNSTPNAKTIDINMSSPLYNIHYDYDTASNSYKRTMAGKPHTDLKSGAQLSPKVVVAISAPWRQNGIYSVYQIIGSGTAMIFQDGIATPVQWTKTDAKTQIKFTDAATHQEVGLDPGQTWVTLVKSSSDTTYAP